MNSSGEWLIPSRLGTKIMPIGAKTAMDWASWPAPEGSRSTEWPTASAASTTVSTNAGSQGAARLR